MTTTPALQQLRIERRGGLAGLKADHECAAAALSAAQRKALDGLVRAADLGPPGAAQGADRYHYSVQLHYVDGSLRSLEVPEQDMPQALAGLVQARF